MKLAVIPPVSCLSEINDREVHLLLPQLYDRYLPYEHFYMDLQKYMKPKFFILDNGAAEGDLYHLPFLYELAEDFGHVDEIVIPDVMGDCQGTLAILKASDLRMKYRHMYVAHGHSALEVLHGAKIAMRKPGVSTIGLPRCLFDTVYNNPHGIRLRVELACAIKRLAQRMGLETQVHLLGASPLWYAEARHAAHCPAIRSMDTSLPYVLASHGYRLDNKSLPKIPQGLKRKDNYFDWNLTKWDLARARENVEHMDRWVEDGRA